MHAIMYVVIVVSLLILLIYYSEELGLHPSIRDHTFIPWSQYKAQLRTGDIVVLCNDGFISSIIRIYDQSPATHTGMIIVERDDIYVYDIDYTTYFGHDSAVKSMSKFMKKHRCKKFGIVPTPRAIPMSLADANAKCKFDVSLGFFPLPGRIYCTKLVHRLQAHHGIEPWDKSCEHKTTPRTYYNDPSIVFVDYEK